MSTEEYIALVYRNLKSDLSPQEFKQLNDLTASDLSMAQLRIEIEDAWDATGEEKQVISKTDTENLISKLKKGETPNIQKKTRGAKRNLRRVVINIAALLLFVLSAVWFMRYRVQTFDQPGIYTLSDQSTIELRSGSRVEIQPFNRSSRNVQLFGEAFFNVAKDASRPFVIRTKDTRTEVLGTSFLIKETSSKTYIELIAGKVSFESLHNESRVELSPGMKAICDNRSVEVSDLYPNLSGWKDGVYQYKSDKLTDILEELEVIFNVEISLVQLALSDCTLSAILTGDNINDILIQIANQLDMKVEGGDKKWILSGGNCK